MRKPRGTQKPEAGHSINECPVFMTLNLIANKWSIRILDQLLSAPKNTQRFSELKRALGNITQRELTKHLREFEKSGIVTRTVCAQMPLRVEYTLTKLGKSLCEPIEALSRWSTKNGAVVQKMRNAFDARNN